ncbi:hypothetical protein MM440_01855 [Arsenicicoccus piscis]|uniref:Uncharacterized protein n=1 Tax=Arsenicicoccus piscis TaxID=673954 RepID=A0ABQ6HU28_9MICO|nr:hypothetical protein [Arsenicicoccus piscis]MCH8626557.1 hypothetical protein [Arsenicicoccus piscis]GMA21203.1 hypothetical protein GCM10025862_32240 [Arsenicicoccus piscis]
MERRTLSFIALTITILYGVSMAAFRDVDGYAPIGAGVVAIAWIAVGILGRGDDGGDRDRDQVRDRG